MTTFTGSRPQVALKPTDLAGLGGPRAADIVPGTLRGRCVLHRDRLGDFIEIEYSCSLTHMQGSETALRRSDGVSYSGWVYIAGEKTDRHHTLRVKQRVDYTDSGDMQLSDRLRGTIVFHFEQDYKADWDDQ